MNKMTSDLVSRAKEITNRVRQRTADETGLAIYFMIEQTEQA